MTVTRSPIRRIPIQRGWNQVRVERCGSSESFSFLVPSYRVGSWRIWLAANHDFTLGHFIELRDDGKMFKVVWHEDGSVSAIDIGDDDAVST